MQHAIYAMCLAAQDCIGCVLIGAQRQCLAIREVVADQLNGAFESICRWLDEVDRDDIVIFNALLERAGQRMRKMRGEQVGLSQRKWNVTRAQESCVHAFLAHGLSLTRIEFSMPSFSKPSDPVTVLEIQGTNIDDVAAIKLLHEFDADVVMHVVVHAVLWTGFECRAATPLLPADLDASRVDGGG